MTIRMITLLHQRMAMIEYQHLCSGTALPIRPTVGLKANSAPEMELPRLLPRVTKDIGRSVTLGGGVMLMFPDDTPCEQKMSR